MALCSIVNSLEYDGSLKIRGLVLEAGGESGRVALDRTERDRPYGPGGLAMNADLPISRPTASTPPPDHAALHHLATHGGAMCTIVGIEGSYSRRIGAQLAIAPDGSCAGDLADNCLDAELAVQAARLAEEGRCGLIRLGAGSPIVDFRLPCGSAIDVVIDPAPDGSAAQRVLAKLDARRPASLTLPSVEGSALTHKHFLPEPRIAVFGDNAECDALVRLQPFYGGRVDHVRPRGLSMELDEDKLDAWSAVLCLSHDHEWERIVLTWALRSDAFLIGALGGKVVRQARVAMLEEMGFAPPAIARIEGPIGAFAAARNARTLAVAVMAQIVQRYEALLDDHVAR